MNEQELIEKLRLVEALVVGGATEGERAAAEKAKARIEDRLRALEAEDPPREYRFALGNTWSRQLFVALARRYGLKPYRYRRQRYTTVMLRVSSRFCDEVLWPEFTRLDSLLAGYLNEVASRVIGEAIHADRSEAEAVAEPARIATVATLGYERD
ncbi:MAG: hypothetical protein AB7N76_21640 [Planctomycetota bacterium]